MGKLIAGFFTLICMLLGAQLYAQAGSDADTISITERLTVLQAYEAELEQERRELAEQYLVLSDSSLLHQILQEQRAGLRQIELADVEEQLTQLRLQHFHLQRQLRQPGIEDQATRQQFEALGQEINTLVEFMSVQQRLAAEIRLFEQQLDEYLFWTPSHPPMNLDWWQTVIPQLDNQLGRIADAAAETLHNVQVRLNIWGILLLLVLVSVLAKRPLLKNQLNIYQSQLLTSDQKATPWLVPKAALTLALYVMPWSLVVLLAGQFISAQDESTVDIGSALTALALSWFMLSFFRHLLVPQGLGEIYFLWSAEQCAVVRKCIVLLAWALIPLSFILAVAAQQNVQIGSDVLGTVLLFVASLYLIGLVIYLFRALPELYGSGFMHRIIGFAILCLPATLVWMLGAGYYYTALVLSGYYLATFYVISVWVIAESGVERAVSISTERMRLRREEAAAMPPEAAESSEAAPVKKNEIDLHEAKSQSLRLARFVMLLGFGFVLFAVWSDALVALDYLNTQLLWQRDVETGFMPISMGSFVSAAFIALFGVILVRNLPGVLEMLVLSRLRLEMGTAYAVTSLVKYVVVSVAVILFLAALGVSWNNLQWLAAGLTVGLGFGLQEIFANFISGLILFFERPVRVGDIVTLNNLSGRVNQIRIRATVITDFDRRDIVVPNRSFITGQFVNWSLSNTVTRITVRVGVAYGSDLEKTREILLDIAAKNERVLENPAPQALFLNFGESTLDHELRMHVGSLSDRNPTIDEVNRAIDQRFKEAGIEIAFRQLDVHFRTAEGLERLVQQHKPT